MIEYIANSNNQKYLNANKNFILKETKYYSKKIPHVYRENCTSCHILEL